MKRYILMGAIAAVLPLVSVLPLHAQMTSEFPMGESAQLTLPTTPIRVGDVVPGVLNRDDSLVSGMYVQFTWLAALISEQRVAWP